MDVSRWTIDERMRLPDWCFGNRQIIGARTNCPVINTRYWAISEIVMPDPVCIWNFNYFTRQDAYAKTGLRIGFRSTVPTSQAEMNTAVEIFPYMGAPSAGPNYISSGQYDGGMYSWDVRKGMVTKGLKFVIEAQSTIANTAFDVALIVSGLPLNISGWLANQFLTKVR